MKNTDHPQGVELTDTGVGALLKAFMRKTCRSSGSEKETAERLRKRMVDAHLTDSDVDIGREARADCYLRFESGEEWRVFRKTVSEASGGVIPEATADSILDFAQAARDGEAWTY